MALIICPECGKEFSNRAPACPNCGFPTSEIVTDGSSTTATHPDTKKILLADKAFDDASYIEAYSLFNDLYATNTDDAHILFRLALSTCAKELLKNGVPKSSQSMINDGMKIIASNQNEVANQELNRFLADANSVSSGISSAYYRLLHEAVGNVEETRTKGEMITDALFMPMISASRNLYEDRKTINKNTQVLQKGLQAVTEGNEAIQALKQFVLRAVSTAFEGKDPLSEENIDILKEYVFDAEDKTLLDKLAPCEADVSGLCFGPEVSLFEDNDAMVLWKRGDTVLNSGGLFGGQSGSVTITNYNTSFTGRKQRASFERSMEGLNSVGVHPKGNGFDLFFDNDEKIVVLFQKGSGTAVVAYLQLMLKLN